MHIDVDARGAGAAGVPLGAASRLAHRRRPRGNLRIKVGLRAGHIVHATPEFEDAADLARTRRVPVRQVLDEAVAAAEAAALRPGEPWLQDGAAI